MNRVSTDYADYADSKREGQDAGAGGRSRQGTPIYHFLFVMIRHFSFATTYPIPLINL
jgi:hypothetical protein